MPVVSVSRTMIIIPASRPSVFQSTASIAVVLADRLRQQDGDGAEQSDLGPVDPLGGDHGERDDEDGDGSGHAGTRADQSSRLTCGILPIRTVHS